jgi:large subunit ribosomal protein L25
MATTQLLKVSLRRRTGSGALKAMRREGQIPAIVYGKSQSNLNIKVATRDFLALMKESSSEHVLVDLDIEGDKKLAMVQQVQHDPLTSGIVHVDFHAVSATETMHALVPVETVGECPGAKAGGLVEILVHEVAVSCLPKDLPDKIVIDLSQVELGESVHIGEIKWPEGVAPDMDSGVVVVLVAEPRTAVEEEGAPAASEPEVLREKKPADK